MCGPVGYSYIAGLAEHLCWLDCIVAAVRCLAVDRNSDLPLAAQY